MNFLRILIKEIWFQITCNTLPRRMYLFSLLFMPLIYSFVSFIMFQQSGQASFLSYVVLGSGMMGMWSSIVFSSSADIVRERENRSLELLMATPTPFWLIMGGRLCTNSLLGLLSLGVALLIVRVFLGQPLYFQSPGLFLLALIATVYTFASLSLLISTLFALSRVARVLQNLIEFPLFLLCGMLFPVEILPSFLRPLSWSLAPTWALQAMREAMTGGTGGFWFHVLFTVALASLYLGLSALLFAKIERSVRISGTLGSI